MLVSDDSRRFAAPREGNAEEKNDLLVYNLVLAIASRAESTSVNAELDKSTQANFQSALNAKLATPTCSIKDVAIVLLAVRLPIRPSHHR